MNTSKIAFTEMTQEEQFEYILKQLGFELKKVDERQGGSVYSYFLYDTKKNEFYPTLEEVVASEDFGLGLKEAGDDFAIEPDENGAYRIVYHGENEQYKTLFDSAYKDRELLSMEGNSLTQMEEECDLDVDQLLELLAPRYPSDIIERLDTFICDSYLKDISEICDGSAYLQGSLDSFEDAFRLEEQLKAHENTDPEVTRLLAECNTSFDEMRFIADGDIDKVNLDEVYNRQEANKSKAAVKSKPIVERD